MSEESPPESPRATLEKTMGDCLASDLETHIKRGVVIVVDEHLNLLDVAMNIAEDNAEQVSTWMQTGQLAQPTSLQIDAWEKEANKRFVSVIVQPYVLVQAVE